MRKLVGLIILLLFVLIVLVTEKKISTCEESGGVLVLTYGSIGGTCIKLINP